jgi:transcriptional regulator with XRE-family HTH domain
MRKTSEKTKNAKGMTINALSNRYGLDRRTLRKYLHGVAPVDTRGSHKFYSLDSVEQAIEVARKRPLDAEGEIKLEILKERLRAAKFRNECEEGKWERREELGAELERITILQRAFLCHQMPHALAYKLIELDYNRARATVFWEIVEMINSSVDHYFHYMRESIFGDSVRAAEEKEKNEIKDETQDRNEEVNR